MCSGLVPPPDTWRARAVSLGHCPLRLQGTARGRDIKMPLTFASASARHMGCAQANAWCCRRPTRRQHPRVMETHSTASNALWAEGGRSCCSCSLAGAQSAATPQACLLRVLRASGAAGASAARLRPPLVGAGAAAGTATGAASAPLPPACAPPWLLLALLLELVLRPPSPTARLRPPPSGAGVAAPSSPASGAGAVREPLQLRTGATSPAADTDAGAATRVCLPLGAIMLMELAPPRLLPPQPARQLQRGRFLLSPSIAALARVDACTAGGLPPGRLV